MATVNSSAYSYGTNTYGSDAYGVDVLPAVASCASSVSVAIIRVKFGSAGVSATSGFSAIGGFTASSGALASCSASATATATRVRQGVEPSNAVSSNTATATATFVSGAVSSVTSTSSSVGEKFILEESGAFAYGTSLYGVGVYDYANFQTIVSATSVGTTASGGIIKSGSAQPGATSAFSVGENVERVREGASNPLPTATVSASAVYSINVAVSISGQSSISSSCNRVRNQSSAGSVTSSTTAVGREKWEKLSLVPRTWTSINRSEETWTKIAA